MSSRALEITVYIGQTIRVSAIFVFAYKVENFENVNIVDVACSIYETISSDEGSIYIFRTNLSYFRLSGKCGNIHLT